jgi:hypothetical protein
MQWLETHLIFAEFAQLAEFAEYNQTDFLVRNLHFQEM